MVFYGPKKAYFMVFYGFQKPYFMVFYGFQKPIFKVFKKHLFFRSFNLDFNIIFSMRKRFFKPLKVALLWKITISRFLVQKRPISRESRFQQVCGHARKKRLKKTYRAISSKTAPYNPFSIKKYPPHSKIAIVTLVLLPLCTSKETTICFLHTSHSNHSIHGWTFCFGSRQPLSLPLDAHGLPEAKVRNPLLGVPVQKNSLFVEKKWPFLKKMAFSFRKIAFSFQK